MTGLGGPVGTLTHTCTQTPQSSRSAPSVLPLALMETDERVQRVGPEMQQLVCDQVFSDL